MSEASSDSMEFFTAVYEVDGPESLARTTAERICFDQTIEAEDNLLPPSLRALILGQLEDLRQTSRSRYEATIRFQGDLLSGDCGDLLNVLFGTSSLRGDVRLLSFTMTKGLLSFWRGPRFGIDGIRQAVDVHDRPLLCAVLKPLGRTAQELARLAEQCVEGGIDLIKDDQSLVDQRWCPFEERVARCAEAIARVGERRGRPCLYFAHVSGALDTMRRRIAQAKARGATGLLVAPGLTGFDAFRALSTDDALALPIASHPSFLGVAVAQSGGGLAPAVVYGQLPRLAGADITIYPSFDSGYPMSREDCIAVADSCRQPWEQVRPTMPSVGGRVGPERMADLGSVLGRDLVMIVGSRVQQEPGGVVAALKEFHRVLSQSF